MPRWARRYHKCVHIYTPFVVGGRRRRPTPAHRQPPRSTRPGQRETSSPLTHTAAGTTPATPSHLVRPPFGQPNINNAMAQQTWATNDNGGERGGRSTVHQQAAATDGVARITTALHPRSGRTPGPDSCCTSAPW